MEAVRRSECQDHESHRPRASRMPTELGIPLPIVPPSRCLAESSSRRVPRVLSLPAGERDMLHLPRGGRHPLQMSMELRALYSPAVPPTVESESDVLSHLSATSQSI